MWIRDPAFGVDFARLVHAGQSTVFHASLPSAASVVATPRIAALHDRGLGKGAVLVVERSVCDADSGLLFATIRQTLLLRGDRGFGGDAPPASSRIVPPERPPDHRAAFVTSPRTALIYRLSGDWNPLHCDPAVAKTAGFDRPILQGLASYGIAAYLIERETKLRLRQLDCRFSGIVMPGDALDLSVWHEGEGRYLWEMRVAGTAILDNGICLLSDDDRDR